LAKDHREAEAEIQFSGPEQVFTPLTNHALIAQWETTAIPAEFARHPAWRDINRVVCPSRSSADAIHKLAPWANIALVPFGIDSGLWGPVVERDWSGPLRFGALGFLDERKAVRETMFAFKEAFGDRTDVCLELCNWNPDTQFSLPEGNIRNIRLTDRPLSREELRAWYQSLHVLCFPSRGEGNGRPPLEMGCTGGAVIATSGMGLDWVTDEIAYPVEWSWVPVPDGTAGQTPTSYRQGEWMEPDVDSIIAQMRAIDADRKEAARRGVNLVSWLRTSRSWDAWADAVLGLIDP